MTFRFTRVGFLSLLLASVSYAPSAFAGGAGASQPNVYEPSLLPSNPKTGECYARVRIAPQYASGFETVLVEDGYSTLEVTQPILSASQKQIETKEASVRYEVRQPRYKTVSERVLVRPAYDKLSVTPPEFTTVTETIQTSGPRRVWKLGNPGALIAKGYTIINQADGGHNGQGYRSTVEYGATRCGAGCEIWCLVEEPGESVSYNRRVLSAPAQVRRVPVSAKYQTVTKQIVADPGGVREIPVPAQYTSIRVEDIVDFGREHRVDVSEKYGEIEKRTLIATERYEWRRVVCDPAKGRVSSSSYGNRATVGRTLARTPARIGAQTGYRSTYSSGQVLPSRNYSHSSSGTTYGHNRSVGRTVGSSSGSVIRSMSSGGSHQAHQATGNVTTGQVRYYGTDKLVHANGH